MMLHPAFLNINLGNVEWTFYAIANLLWIILASPLHRGLMQLSLVCWQDSRPSQPQPGWLVQVGLAGLSWLVALLSVAIMVQIYTGLPWREVILILSGQY